MEKQCPKNRTVDNKNNNQQQKSKVDLPYVEIGLVVYKSNQFLEIYGNEAYFKIIQNLMLRVIFHKKINMDNKIIKNLSSKKKSSKREETNKSKTYSDIENKIKNNSERDINNKNKIENIIIEYNKKIDINIINNKNEKQDRVGTDNIDNKNKIENNNSEINVGK